MRKSAPVLGLFAASLVAAAPLAVAQGVTDADLSLEPPQLQLPPATGPFLMHVAWTLTFPDPASAAAALADGAGAIRWTIACSDAVTVPADAATPVQHEPGEVAYAGVADVPGQVEQPIPGLTAVECTLTGTFAGSAGPTGEDSQAFESVVPFVPNATAVPASTERKTGPQKQMPYPIDVTNNGSARMLVEFEVSKRPGGKWLVLLPDAMILEPGATQTATVMVATPYENGYNSGDTDLVVRVTTAAADAPEMAGPVFDIPLHAKVEGFYVPGPSLGLALLVLGGVAALARRRV